VPAGKGRGGEGKGMLGGEEIGQGNKTTTTAASSCQTL